MFQDEAVVLIEDGEAVAVDVEDAAIGEAPGVPDIAVAGVFEDAGDAAGAVDFDPLIFGGEEEALFGRAGEGGGEQCRG